MVKDPAPRMRVDQIRVRESAAVPETRVVSAAVYLDGMRPTDAAVELRVEPAADAPPAVPTRRMWSEQAYSNGCFMFVTRVRAEDLSRGCRLEVRVRPVHAEDEPGGPEATGSVSL